MSANNNTEFAECSIGVLNDAKCHKDDLFKTKFI